MSSFEMMRGKALLQNLNNARIRYNRARETGAAEAKTISHEVAYLHAMWREHVKKCSVDPVDIPLVQHAPSEPLAA
jgi:hypothetical protein